MFAEIFFRIWRRAVLRPGIFGSPEVRITKCHFDYSLKITFNSLLVLKRKSLTLLSKKTRKLKAHIMLTQIINGKILTPQGWLKDGSVLISDSKILEVTNCDLAVVGATLIDAKGMYIVPGVWKFTCMEVEAVILWKAPRTLSVRQ